MNSHVHVHVQCTSKIYKMYMYIHVHTHTHAASTYLDREDVASVSGWHDSHGLPLVGVPHDGSEVIRP